MSTVNLIRTTEKHKICTENLIMPTVKHNLWGVKHFRSLRRVANKGFHVAS